MTLTLRKLKTTTLAIFTVLLFSCASTNEQSNQTQLNIPFPSELLTPHYLEDNSGLYMSPFTSDLVVADWVSKAIDADIGTNLGGLIGTHVGRQLVSEIPFIGATVGRDLGELAGTELALNAIGGKDFLKESSDISFNNIEDMAVYLFKFNSEHPSYLAAVKATMVLYPALKKSYNTAIVNAQRW